MLPEYYVELAKESDYMTCPRCGEEIEFLPCSNCGFPVLFRPLGRKWRKRRLIRWHFEM